MLAEFGLCWKDSGACEVLNMGLFIIVVQVRLSMSVPRTRAMEPLQTASAAKGCMTQDAFSRVGLHCLSSERAERPGHLSQALGDSGGPS